MADLKQKDITKEKNRRATQAAEDRMVSDSKNTGFLDDDLEEDFVPEAEAEAFLNEVGDFFDHGEKGKGTLEKGGKGPIAEVTITESLNKNEVPSPAFHSSGVTKKPAIVEENIVGKAEEKVEEKAPRKGKKIAIIAAATAMMVVLAAGGTYVAMGSKYDRVFFPNTQINGIDASGKSVEEIKQVIASGIDDYVLSIETRDGKTERIGRDDINLRSEFDGSLEKLLAAQEPLKWLRHQLNPSDYQIKTMIVYDEQPLYDTINKLDFMNPTLMTVPENAVISAYIPGQGYTVVPEIPGTTVNPDAVKAAVKEAIAGLVPTLSLESAGAYQAPAILKEDPALVALCGEMNKYAGITVTYRFGDVTEVLNGDRIKDWLVINEDHTISLNPELIAGYVEELSIAHDTYNKAKTLKTSYGPTIEIRGGNYGWRINRKAEAEALMEVIKTGQSVEREPVYSQQGASRGANDYGNTYVEINLTAQHLFFYKNGSLLVESDFVSGNPSRGWTTPPGSFPLTYKQRNATLKGEGYRTPVDYWMPFNGGIGMHDAKWRSSFGGNIYKTGGSHGCINLPHSVAKVIYENISSGMPVLCYNLSGTESKGSSQAKPPQTAVPPTQAPAETLPQAPAESLPQNPVETSPQTPVTPPQTPVTPPQTPVMPPQTPIPPTQTPTETTAPAGPGADSGTSGPVGPGAV